MYKVETSELIYYFERIEHFQGFQYEMDLMRGAVAVINKRTNEVLKMRHPIQDVLDTFFKHR